MNLTKEEKKALLNAYKQKQNKKYLLKKRDAKSLFGYISKQLAKSGCDHTLRYTEQWLIKKYEDEQIRQQALDEIKEDGGCCDCEVILNCYERYELDYEV